jgi:hypothetical protein
MVDAVISQIHGTRRVLLASARGEPILNEQEENRIDIVMRDNLP